MMRENTCLLSLFPSDILGYCQIMSIGKFQKKYLIMNHFYCNKETMRGN